MSVQVELADPAITVHGWMPSWDHLGMYRLRIRKTPQELKAEKERLRNFYGINKKVNPMKFEEHSVIEHDADIPDTVYFLPGLWPRIKNFFDKQQIQYEIVADHRSSEIRPQIDFNAIKDVQFRETQDLALALIATSDCGIIDCSVGYGKSWLVGVISKAFPTLRILVCTGSVSVVNTLYEYLCKQVPGEVGIIGGGKNNVQGKRVVISTLRSLEKIPAQWPQLALIDECHEISNNDAGKQLMRFAFCRRFGFSASPVRADGSQLAMEAILGPVIMQMSYEEASEQGMVVPMRYAMLHCNWCPSICHKDDLSEVLMKRFAYWRNEARNRVIADYVYKLLAVDKDIQILILCQTLEAAIALHQHLPGFLVAYYGSCDISDIQKRFPKEKYPKLNLDSYKLKQKDLDRMRGAFSKGTLRRIISTTVFRQGERKVMPLES